MRGKFIVIEGLDGTGKTTQAKLLFEKLQSRGTPAALTAEPTDGEIGRLIRRAISGALDYSGTTLAALFLADRIDHNIKPKGIRELLEKGINVISDRYYYSTFAYQGTGENIGNFEWVSAQNLACPDIETPDICIFLDMEPQRCMERITENRAGESLDIFENIASLTDIRLRFHFVMDKLSKKQRIEIINADGGIEDIHEKILTIVDTLL